MKESTVCIVKDPNPETAVEEALRLLGGPEAFVKRDSTVLVKPNISYPIPPNESPAVTHPDVVAAVFASYFHYFSDNFFLWHLA